MASSHTQNAGDHKHDCELSSKYTDFISHNIDSMKSKCKEFTACIYELLSHQSTFALIGGEDLNLRTICSLIQDDDSSTYSTESSGHKCTKSEREDIKNDIESHLNSKIAEQQSWNKVRKCLENNYGDKEKSTYVNDICRLAIKEDRVCNKQVHNQLKSFFNEELHHLRCTCESLNAQEDGSQVPVGAIAGGVVGGLVVLVLAVLLAIFCYKYKKTKKKKNAPNVIYLPAPNADYPVYQEVFDDPYDPRYRPSPPTNPPALPKRPKYDPTDENAYLEPVPSGSYRAKTINNPNYGDPPEYSEREETKPSETETNEYIEALPEPPPVPNGQEKASSEAPDATDVAEDEEHSGYDTLLKDQDDNAESQQSYEPFNSFKKLGPVPAERKKKDERQQESTYFELEADQDEVAGTNTTV